MEPAESVPGYTDALAQRSAEGAIGGRGVGGELVVPQFRPHHQVRAGAIVSWSFRAAPGTPISDQPKTLCFEEVHAVSRGDRPGANRLDGVMEAH